MKQQLVELTVENLDSINMFLNNGFTITGQYYSGSAVFLFMSRQGE